MHTLKVSDILFIALSIWLVSKLVVRARRNLHLTRLGGPGRRSFLFGVLRYLNEASDSAIILEEWASKYGPVYQIPGVLGSKRVVLCDPKAVAHFYARETVTYVQTGMAKTIILRMFGNGILVAEGDSHKRQRKALTPAFSNIAIRRLTSVFYDSAYKLKTMWDSMIESSPNGQVVDVQSWMNRVSLDSIGIAGFSHDFNSLDGQASSVSDLFDTFAGLKPTPKTFLTKILTPLGMIIFLLGSIFPVLFHLPTERSKMTRKFKDDTAEIAEILLDKTRKEKELGIVDEKGDKSIVGLLIKAESAESQLRLSKEEISAQMTTLLLAGYETTSISLTWALIELCIQPHIQEKLRTELSRLNADNSQTDPTWDQLTSTTEFPYLDAVVQETLRMHPPLAETHRVAATDDVIPLSSPISVSSPSFSASMEAKGYIDSVAVPKGTPVVVPIRCINRSEAFWGEDAKKFRPERWLEHSSEGGIPKAAREISGHRHLLTFVDGPRTCLGKGFALAEFKAVLSVLIRNYIFEFPEGKDKIPNIALHRSILPRPKIEGEQGARVPLRVKRV